MRVFSQVVRKTFLPYDKRCKKQTYLHIACIFLQLGSVSSTNALINKNLQDIPPLVFFMNCLYFENILNIYNLRTFFDTNVLHSQIIQYIKSNALINLKFLKIDNK